MSPVGCSHSAQDEGDRLLADLQAGLPAGQMEAAMKQVDVKIFEDQARDKVLAYVQEHETG